MSGRISWQQLALLLIVSRVFAEAMNFPYGSAVFGMQRFTVVLVVKIAVAIVYIPLFLLAARGKSAFDTIADKSPLVAWVTGILLTFYFVTTSAGVCGKLNLFVTETLAFDAAPAAVVILLMAAGAYGAFKGFSGIARSAVFISVIFAVLLLLASLSLAGKMDFSRLYPVLVDDTGTLFSQILQEAAKNNEIVLFSIIAGTVRSGAKKTLLLYIPVVLILTLFMTLMYNTVLGEYLNFAHFPFYTIASLSDISLFERLDGIDVAVWTLTAALRIAVTLAAIRMIWHRLLMRRGGIAAAVIAFFAILALGICFAVSRNLFTLYGQIFGTALPVLICGAVFPLAALVLSLTQKGQKSGKPHLEEV